MRNLVQSLVSTTVIIGLIGPQVQARMALPMPNRDTITGVQAAAPAYCHMYHYVGKLKLGFTNYGVIGGFESYYAPLIDCFTGLPLENGEYPGDTGNDYMYHAALWVGAIVGEDTLVSVGVDGWQLVRELYPDGTPLGLPVRWSAIDTSSFFDPRAHSDVDLIAAYADTYTCCVPYLGDDWVTGLPHQPLGIEVEQRSYAWSTPVAEDIIFAEFNIRNISSSDLQQVYIGVFVDGDANGTDNISEAWDDYAGFTASALDQWLPADCAASRSINAAWIADNDGEMDRAEPLDDVVGLVPLSSPSSDPTVSFNWWISNADPALDIGPQLRTNMREFQSGGTGTPVGDRNKYYVLSNGEQDFNEAYLASIGFDDPVWYIPHPAIIHGGSCCDAFYLLSVGPIDLPPGAEAPLTVAFVGGESYHVLPGNFLDNLHSTYRPDEYYANLDPSDFFLNGFTAQRIFDNPGVDTDQDGYAGEFIVCREDTVWVEGDGVPDRNADIAPPSPPFEVTPGRTGLTLTWGGYPAESAFDRISGRRDWQGYRVYRSVDGSPGSFQLVASLGQEIVVKYVWNGRLGLWKREPVVYDQGELRCLYADASCEDMTFDPLAFTESQPFVLNGFPDSTFYFASVGLQSPDESGSVGIIRTTSEKTAVESQYYQYTCTVGGLLEGHEYWVAVTATDYDPATGISLESGILQAAVVDTTLLALDIPGPGEQLPGGFVLRQNYPNPFNPTTKISFSLSQAGKTRLVIFNSLGQRVRTLLDMYLPAGEHSIEWDGRGNDGKEAATGVYLLELQSGKFRATHKMTLQK